MDNRAGTRAGRIVRLVRLVRILKLYKQAMSRRKRDEEDDEFDDGHSQSRVGKKLSGACQLSQSRQLSRKHARVSCLVNRSIVASKPRSGLCSGSFCDLEATHQETC